MRLRGPIVIIPKEPPVPVAVSPEERLGQFPRFEGPLGGPEGIPKGRGALYRVFGDPRVSYDRRGRVKVDRAWERQNLILARDLPIVGRLYVHRLMEPYLREGLRRAAIVCPGWRPAKAGCFAPRHQRHDPTRPLSDHTWAIAVDFADPDGRFRAQGSSMPEPWGAALESVGFEWGRRWRSFPDDMHFQLRRT